MLGFFSEEDAVLAGWLQPDSSADVNGCGKGFAAAMEPEIDQVRVAAGRKNRTHPLRSVLRGQPKHGSVREHRWQTMISKAMRDWQCPWMEISKGSKHWHSSHRGAALCRVFARRRSPNKIRSRPLGYRHDDPSLIARAFAHYLPALVAMMVVATGGGECSKVRDQLADSM